MSRGLRPWDIGTHENLGYPPAFSTERCFRTIATGCYAGRQAALLSAAHRECAGLPEVSPVEAGMHLVAWLPPGPSDGEASRRASTAGVTGPALSGCSVHRDARPAPLPGYAAVNTRKISEGARRLAGAMINWLR